jgi:3-oxoacyl-[acyl-carrier protein] reductase
VEPTPIATNRMNCFVGKSVLVTGGTRGIGNSIANEFYEQGAKVYVTGRSLNLNLNKNFVFLECDFSERSQVEKVATQLSTIQIDILVNNAGINKIGSVENYDVADFDLIYEVNVRTPFLLTKALLPAMKKQNWGRIVNISSVFGKLSKELRGAYSASKFALDGFTVAVAAEYSQFGVLANCVAPGFIDTELTRNILGDEGIQKMISQVPIKRLGTATEIAKLVLWLASEENTFVTGQNIAADGGFTRV